MILGSMIPGCVPHIYAGDKSKDLAAAAGSCPGSAALRGAALHLGATACGFLFTTLLWALSQMAFDMLKCFTAEHALKIFASIIVGGIVRSPVPCNSSSEVYCRMVPPCPLMPLPMAIFQGRPLPPCSMMYGSLKPVSARPCGGCSMIGASCFVHVSRSSSPAQAHSLSRRMLPMIC